MRIATKTMYDNVYRSLARTSTDMANANETVSTGKRINKLSDDPVGLVSVLDLRSSLSEIGQMERNISMGRSWLTSAESALTQVEDLLSTTKALSVQMSNATTGASERENSVSLVDGYLNQIISLANTQVGDRYIFGGTETDTVTFVMNEAETLVEYHGNDTPFSIKLGKETSVAVGKDGKDVFGGDWSDENMFKTLIDLRDSLQNNDVEGIQESMNRLDNHLKNIRSSISDIGGKNIRLNVKEQIIEDLELTYTERKSNLEDADIAEAIIDLKAKELAYNASLNSASKVMQLSLVDYL